MNRRRVLVAATILLASMTVSLPNASAQAPSRGITIPLLDTATSDVVLTVTRFVRSGDQVLAVGTVTATVIDTATNVVTTTTQQVRIPLLLGASSGTCEILNLVLGPLDLNLLGLAIHLDQVVLNIEAVSGPGNLLGNLLCAVAGLLDGTGPLGQLVARLNQILGAL